MQSELNDLILNMLAQVNVSSFAYRATSYGTALGLIAENYPDIPLHKAYRLLETACIRRVTLSDFPDEMKE